MLVLTHGNTPGTESLKLNTLYVLARVNTGGLSVWVVKPMIAVFEVTMH
jgi:hypothetical protein